jgi:hypothetical protein
MKYRPFPIAIGLYGALLGSALFIGLFAGALNVELHGFRLITLSQAIWFILAAIPLWRSRYTTDPIAARS